MSPALHTVHLYWRPAVGVGVEVLVYSVQQPQQKLLSIVLSVAFELGGVFRHGVLQQTMWARDYNAFKVRLSNFSVTTFH